MNHFNRSFYVCVSIHIENYKKYDGGRGGKNTSYQCLGRNLQQFVVLLKTRFPLPLMHFIRIQSL